MAYKQPNGSNGWFIGRIRIQTVASEVVKPLIKTQKHTKTKNTSFRPLIPMMPFHENWKNNYNSKKHLFIVGDFNARLHAKIGQHELCIGQHVFGRGFNFLQNSASSQSLENRSLFVEFCIAHDLHIGNTLFQKDASQQPFFPRFFP